MGVEKVNGLGRRVDILAKIEPTRSKRIGPPLELDCLKQSSLRDGVEGRFSGILSRSGGGA